MEDRMRTWIAIAVIVACALAALLVTSAAFAQAAQCAPRDVVVAALEDSYGETRQMIALMDGEKVLEFYASDAADSWTITVTGTTGISCVMAVGQHSEWSTPVPEERPYD